MIFLFHRNLDGDNTGAGGQRGSLCEDECVEAAESVPAGVNTLGSVNKLVFVSLVTM